MGYNITAPIQELTDLKFALQLAYAEMELANDSYQVIDYTDHLATIKKLIEAVNKSINEPLPF